MYVSLEKPARSKRLRMFEKENNVCLTLDESDYYVAPDAVLAVFALCDGTRTVDEIVIELIKHNKTTTVNPRMLTKAVRETLQLLRGKGFIE